MSYRDCASTRGQWGDICPDCGQRLPNPGPVASWLSQRPLEFTSGSSAGLGARSWTRPPRDESRMQITRRARPTGAQT